MATDQLSPGQYQGHLPGARTEIAVIAAGFVAWAGIFMASARGLLHVSWLVSDGLLAGLGAAIAWRLWRLCRLAATAYAGPAEIASSSFAARHQWDRGFFLAYAAMAWLSIVMGFGPGVKGQLTGQSPFPHPIVHVHALVFSGWLVLFTLQAWLVRSGRLHIHRKLGLVATALVPVMVVLGVATALISRRVYFEAGNTQLLAFMIVPLTDMVLFPSFAIPGLLLRRDPATHKRLMLLATATLLPASFGRWIGPGILAHFGDGFFGFMAQSYLGPDAMILAAVIYDRVTRGRVHAIYFIAIPWMLAVQAITSAIYHWSGWMPLAQRLIGH